MLQGYNQPGPLGTSLASSHVALGIPGSDPNEVAKQPGPLGTSLASSQLGTLPGGFTGAGRSVGEVGPLKMAAVQGLFAGSIPLHTKTL
jgi:hypothetical protein